MYLSKTLPHWSKTHDVIVHTLQSVCLIPGSVVQGVKAPQIMAKFTWPKQLS